MIQGDVDSPYLPPPTMRYKDIDGYWHDAPPGTTVVTEDPAVGSLWRGVARRRMYVELPVAISDVAFTFIPVEQIVDGVRLSPVEFRMPASPETFTNLGLTMDPGTGKVTQVKKYGVQLGDNSPELIAWLRSPDGCQWSRNKHISVQHHALIEDHDDHRPNCACAAGGDNVYWDNSRFTVTHSNGPQVNHEHWDMPVPADPDYVF